MTKSGLVPIPPVELRAQLVDGVSETNPGFTANLPASLIEDIVSTDVFAITQQDQFRIEFINSLTPYGANAFLLNQLGQIYGVSVGEAANTSVYVQFSGTPGFVISKGFTVSDGTYQYIVQEGAIVGEDGNSPLVYCLAALTGIWPVAPGTVTQVVTSVPEPNVLTVDNPESGIPGTGAESEESFRSRVLQAGLAASQGMTRYLKTILGRVSGVQPRLVSPIQVPGRGWLILVGGGDPYEVAYAIFEALFDINYLVPSEIEVTEFTQANPGVVTTSLAHGYEDGDTVVVTGSLVSAYNDTYIITKVDNYSFEVDVDTTGYAAYTSGGICTPNPRNRTVSVQDYPNTYVIPFVVPPQQEVLIGLAWDTISTNVVSSSAMAQLGKPAIAAYVNSIAAGQPINLFMLESAFQDAVVSILAPELLTRMVFTVTIDGEVVPPEAGTGIIAGDPQSFFFIEEADINIVQA